MCKSMVLLVIFIIISISTTSVFSYDKVLKFGIFPYQSSKSLVKLFGPIASRIEKETEYEINIVTAPSYEEYMLRVKAGDYDIIMPCTACYLSIKKKGFPYEAVAMGTPPFYGGVIVRKDSGISNIEQLKGEKIAAIGPFSYAAYIYFRNKVKELGYSMKNEYKFIFLGKLDSVVFAVVNRRFKAGLIRIDALESRVFKSVKKDLIIIDKSEEIPQFPFAVNLSLDKTIVKSIVRVLTNMSIHNKQDMEIFKRLKMKSIVEANDSDYDKFRKIYKE